MKAPIVLSITLFVYYNFIKNHSSLSNLTPAQVCGINYTHQEKVNWFIKY